MADSISPIVDLKYLFAAPIEAVIAADFMAAEQFVEYLEHYGFVGKPPGVCVVEPPDKGEIGELRMITFFYDQPVGGGKTEKRRVQIPALSLIPLPLLEVKAATFDFGVRLLLAEEVKTKPCAITLLPNGADPDDEPRDEGRCVSLSRGEHRREGRGGAGEYPGGYRQSACADGDECAGERPG